jgi:putative hydroxymethylpyrimidine transport system permease protein
VITSAYALCGLILGAILALLLLVSSSGRVFRPLGDVVAVGLKSAPAFVFPLVLGDVFGATGFGGFFLKVIVVALICFFPILVGARDGRNKVPESLLRTCRALGGAPRRVAMLVELPWILVGFLEGLKSAAPLAAVGAVVAEFVSATQAQHAGLGAVFATRRNFGSALIEPLVVVTAIGCALFFAMNLLSRSIDKRLRLASR